MYKRILCFFIILTLFSSLYAQTDYLNVINKSGQEPVKFVNNLLNDHDLLILDDALHLAKEPFDFYQKLIKNDQFKSKVKYIFIEVISITSTEDFIEYVKHNSKINPDKLFREWFYEGIYSHYIIDGLSIKEIFEKYN